MSRGEEPDFCARELVLAAAARAVLGALCDSLELNLLPARAAASLRVLESALDPYGGYPLPPSA